MKGEVLVSFAGYAGAQKIRGTVGDIIDVPPGVDWVQAGLVRLIEEPDRTPEEKPKRAKAKS